MTISYVPKPLPPYDDHESDPEKLGRSFIPWGRVRQELIRHGVDLVTGDRQNRRERVARWRGLELTFNLHRFKPSCGGTCWRVIDAELSVLAGAPFVADQFGSTEPSAFMDLTGWEWVDERDVRTMAKLYPSWKLGEKK